MANSRFTDNPFRDPNLPPEQHEYLARRNAALRHYYSTGDPEPIREFGFNLPDKRERKPDPVESNTRVWVVHSEHGRYTGHFVDGCYAAAGWLREHDLSAVKTRDELKAIYRQYLPDHSLGTVGANVGMLWLFLQMEYGDYVVAPCSDSQWVYYGRVIQMSYYYAPNDKDGCPFPHRRYVDWSDRRINLSEFSEGLQRTVRFTQKAVFRVKQSEEFISKVTNRVFPPWKYDKDEICDRGKEIYEKQIRAMVEPQENGKFIVIDIKSGDYEIDWKGLVASRRLRERHPDAIGYLGKVGRDAAYRIGLRPGRIQ